MTRSGFSKTSKHGMLQHSNDSGRGSGSTNNADNNVAVWKTLTFTLAAILLLFLTGRVQVRHMRYVPVPAGFEFKEATAASHGIGQSLEGKTDDSTPATGSDPGESLEEVVQSTLIDSAAQTEDEGVVVDGVTQPPDAMKEAADDTVTAGRSSGDAENAGSNNGTPPDHGTAFEDVAGDDQTASAVPDVPHSDQATAEVAEYQDDARAGPGANAVATEDDATVTNRHTYERRGQPMSEADRQAMIDKERPTKDYYASFPNRDIPRTQFPANAWQVDEEYLSKFLPEALKLVERTQEAILAEYGKTEGTWEERTEMFALEMFETLEGTSRYIVTQPEWRKDNQGSRGGWSTTRSWEGLKRRLLHAVMTEDSFIFALGGHSAAAGHGNMFQQSYSVQVMWILEAVFARLGVRHEGKNFANGGLGTIQHGIGASSVYGPAVDMLMWDSSKYMTTRH
jgi:hypothetical protein